MNPAMSSEWEKKVSWEKHLTGKSVNVTERFVSHTSVWAPLATKGTYPENKIFRDS